MAKKENPYTPEQIWNSVSLAEVDSNPDSEGTRALVRVILPRIQELLSANMGTSMFDPSNPESNYVSYEQVKIAALSYLKQSSFQFGSSINKAITDGLYKYIAQNDILQRYIEDPDVTEIMINGPDKIYIERHGKIEKIPEQFHGTHEYENRVIRLVENAGKQLHRLSPMVDARIKVNDVSLRINVTIPPVAANGLPLVTIRKAAIRAMSLDELAAKRGMSEDMAEFLKACVKANLNIIIAGGAGSGKTTLASALLQHIPVDQRVITIEDTMELQVPEHLNAARLETMVGDEEKTIDSNDLVANALRMRPNRLIIGECRGGEALAMLQAMNTGQDGSMTTLHANSPQDAISRLETLVLMSGMDLPYRAVKGQIASAVHILVQQIRLSNGHRCISHISEVYERSNKEIEARHIFHLEDFRTMKYLWTGYIPTFWSRTKNYIAASSAQMFDGNPVELSIYTPSEVKYRMFPHLAPKEEVSGSKKSKELTMDEIDDEETGLELSVPINVDEYENSPEYEDPDSYN